MGNVTLQTGTTLAYSTLTCDINWSCAHIYIHIYISYIYHIISYMTYHICAPNSRTQMPNHGRKSPTRCWIHRVSPGTEARHSRWWVSMDPRSHCDQCGKRPSHEHHSKLQSPHLNHLTLDLDLYDFLSFVKIFHRFSKYGKLTDADSLTVCWQSSWDSARIGFFGSVGHKQLLLHCLSWSLNPIP